MQQSRAVVPFHPFDGDDDDDDDDDNDGHEFVASSPESQSGISSAFSKAILEEVKTPPLNYLTTSGNDKNASGISPLIEVSADLTIFCSLILSFYFQTKIGVVRMLSSCHLPSQEVAWLWALATSDTHHRYCQISYYFVF